MRVEPVEVFEGLQHLDVVLPESGKILTTRAEWDKFWAENDVTPHYATFKDDTFAVVVNFALPDNETGEHAFHFFAVDRGSHFDIAWAATPLFGFGADERPGAIAFFKNVQKPVRVERLKDEPDADLKFLARR